MPVSERSHLRLSAAADAYVESLEAEVERLREAIREHRAQIVMGARSGHELNEADEALWRNGEGS